MARLKYCHAGTRDKQDRGYGWPSTNKEPLAALSRFNFENVHIGLVINVYIFRELRSQ